MLRGWLLARLCASCSGTGLPSFPDNQEGTPSAE